MKALYALYSDPESAQQAVNDLRMSGIDDRAIVILSAEPFDEYEFGKRDDATWLPWIAAGGGAIGLAFGAWFTSTVPALWPIVTGGMPIVAPWPNLILLFELTMLGSILATVVGLCVSAGLARRRTTLYDPEISTGHVLIGVERPDDTGASRLELQAALAQRGAGRVKTVE